MLGSAHVEFFNLGTEPSRKARSLASRFPAVSITGPCQSVKPTLVKALFPTYSYVSLEDEDLRSFATDDPRGFLARFGRETVFDKAQPRSVT